MHVFQKEAIQFMYDCAGSAVSIIPGHDSSIDWVSTS